MPDIVDPHRRKGMWSNSAHGPLMPCKSMGGKPLVLPKTEPPSWERSSNHSDSAGSGMSSKSVAEELRNAPVFQDAKARWIDDHHLFQREYQGPGSGMQFHSLHALEDVPRKNISHRLWETSYSSVSTTTSTQMGDNTTKQSEKFMEKIDKKVEPSTKFRTIEDEKNFFFLKSWCMEFEKAGAVTQSAKTAKNGAHLSALPETHPVRAGRDVTTIMVKNIPNRVRAEDLVEKLDELGFAGRCDYVYMPMDWKTHANKGFAFANFKTAKDALELAEKIEGTALFGKCNSSGSSSSSGKRMTSCPATLQGIVQNLRSVSYTCRKNKLEPKFNFPWVLIGDAPTLVGMRPPEALERLKQWRDPAQAQNI